VTVRSWCFEMDFVRYRLLLISSTHIWCCPRLFHISTTGPCVPSTWPSELHELPNLSRLAGYASHPDKSLLSTTVWSFICHNNSIFEVILCVVNDPYSIYSISFPYCSGPSIFADAFALCLLCFFYIWGHTDKLSNVTPLCRVAADEESILYPQHSKRETCIF